MVKEDQVGQGCLRLVKHGQGWSRMVMDAQGWSTVVKDAIGWSRKANVHVDFKYVSLFLVCIKYDS